MPPKPKTIEEQIAGLSALMEGFGTQLSTLNSKIDRLEGRLVSMQAENVALKEDLVKKDDEILNLKYRVHHIEQRNRAKSIRIFGLKLTGDTTDNEVVTAQVYNLVLRPILEGAVLKGRLSSAPSCEDLIEVAHILPGADGKPKPIIVRLRSQATRLVILHLRSEFTPRANLPVSTRASVSGNRTPAQTPFICSIFEDSTRDLLSALKNLKDHEEVEMACIAGGLLRYRLKSNPTMALKSGLIYSSTADIIKQ